MREGYGDEEAKDLLDVGLLNDLESATPALVAAWAGEPEKAKEYWEWGLKVAKQDKDKMVELYGDLVNNPDLLRATARAERIRHKFEYAPYQDIVGVPYKETWPD